jgi:cyclopropane fatty-acyl-phospholipid synthase-like methyltransferase
MNWAARPKENSKDWWESKYQDSTDFVYSKTPSDFLVSQWDLFPIKAKILELGSGEGRNAVAMALKGFQVTAIDFSETAMKRAEALARESNATVHWKKSDLDFFLPELLSFDAIVVIDYRPAPTLLKNLVRGLKKDGLLLMESFLTPMCIERKDLEVFETFKPGEMLRVVQESSPSLRCVYYSELGPERLKANLIARKVEML